MKPFVKISLALMAARAVVNKKTGEVLELQDSDKMIYIWMYSQYTHLLSQGKEFFHNQDFIAKCTKKSVSAVEKFVRRFVAFGIVHRKQIPIKHKGAVVSNSYKLECLDNTDLFDYVFDDTIDKEYLKFIISDVREKATPHLKNNKTAVHTTFARQIDDPF